METIIRRLVAMHDRDERDSADDVVPRLDPHRKGPPTLEAGLLRYKFRNDRRPGLPRVPAWRFYPQYVFETMSKMRPWLSTYTEHRRIYVRIKRDARRYEYTDLALTPVTDSEMDTLDLCHHTEAAEAFTARERRPEHAAVAR